MCGDLKKQKQTKTIHTGPHLAFMKHASQHHMAVHLSIKGITLMIIKIRSRLYIENIFFSIFSEEKYSTLKKLY